MTVTVTAKEDLESAQKRGENEIIVTENLPDRYAGAGGLYY